MSVGWTCPNADRYGQGICPGHHGRCRRQGDSRAPVRNTSKPAKSMTRPLRRAYRRLETAQKANEKAGRPREWRWPGRMDKHA